MSYTDLRDWIAALESAGELKRVRAEVDPILEITEITDRVSKRRTPTPGGPALLFENVKGHPGHKVLINQFGSERRMAMALGVERLDEIAERIQGLMNVKAPEGCSDKLKMLPQLADAGQVLSQDGAGEGCAVQGSDPARGFRSRMRFRF